MPIFGNIGLSLPGSGSEITSSFDVLPVYFSSVSYSREAATIGTLEAFVTSYDDTGSYGELSFRVSSKENRSTTGSKVLTIFSTGSNDEPRVGIGFGENEKPIRAFEIKTKSNTVEGSEILIRSSRNPEGAVIGDLAGAIRFTIDSASYGDITTSGSVALIDAITTKVSEEGVQGDLSFGIASVRDTDAPTEILRLRENDGAPKVTITGSLETTDDIVTPTIDVITVANVGDDSATVVDTYSRASYNGAIYDYILYDATVGARAGQFMVADDGSNVTYTDTSTRHTLDPIPPSITANINSTNMEIKITNGDGYRFKAFVKKL